MVFLAAFGLSSARYIVPAYSSATTWLDNDVQRLPNIREVTEECRGPFIRKFLSLQDWDRPSMLVFGDSQSVAMGVPKENTWSEHFKNRVAPELQVINLAVIDGRPGDAEFIARQVPGEVEISVYGLNQSHFVGAQHRNVPSVEETPFEFLRCVSEMRRFLAMTPLSIPGAGSIPETYSAADLPADRYDLTIDGPVVRSVVQAVADTASRSVVFVAPNNSEAFDAYGYDIPRYAADSAGLTEECKAADPQVLCFNMSGQLGMGSFYDIIHFNTQGNARFGELLGERYFASAQPSTGKAH
ncbi:hypothetical protein [Devosia rhizoryzae]|nr:hypothetical protein [Devosia rhizoryzae]